MLGRTAVTDLTDCELTLLDAFVWNDMCLGSLLAENYGLHLNLPRSHEFTRDEVLAAAYRLERDRRHLVCIEDSQNELDRYYQLTKRGFEAWEEERDPPWLRYCELWSTTVDGESDRSGPSERLSPEKVASGQRYLLTVVAADKAQGLASLRALAADRDLVGSGEGEVEESLPEYTVLRYKVLRNVWRLGCHCVHRSDRGQHSPLSRTQTWWENLSDLYVIQHQGEVR